MKHVPNDFRCHFCVFFLLWRSWVIFGHPWSFPVSFFLIFEHFCDHFGHIVTQLPQHFPLLEKFRTRVFTRVPFPFPKMCIASASASASASAPASAAWCSKLLPHSMQTLMGCGDGPPQASSIYHTVQVLT